MQLTFWLLLFIVFYTYIGYGILIYIIILVKRRFKTNIADNSSNFYEPEVTLFIPAFNEKDFVQQKIENCLELDYPIDKLHVLWVTDGSDDGSVEELMKYPEIEVMHKPDRRGKIAAMNRGMKYVSDPIVIFTDANTILPKHVIYEVVNQFRDAKVGCVSGEKRIYNSENEAAAAAGEGLYWKYESTLKKLDFELYSAVGAAGELFAVRKELYRDVEPDTLLDDFIISMRICMQGYKIAYNPDAYALETSSVNVKEELKRKIRISAGGIQSVLRLIPLLNFLKYGILSFQYFSHRVLRWTLTPMCILALFFVNLSLILSPSPALIYTILFSGQVIFYLLALLGWILENRKIKLKFLFIPY
ncbi:MAG: glycosyltransferase family 2 protein, partial [Bacteroidetes bacterium]|nr:glycosyltransferase family 2 protein [Bacteroidota bacterium]